MDPNRSLESDPTNHIDRTSVTAGDDTEQQRRKATVMRGMHPATSATSNLYNENVTPTNGDGLGAIYGVELQPPALFCPSRG